jgi:hypothetical protein
LIIGNVSATPAASGRKFWRKSLMSDRFCVW